MEKEVRARDEVLARLRLIELREQLASLVFVAWVSAQTAAVDETVNIGVEQAKNARVEVGCSLPRRLLVSKALDGIGLGIVAAMVHGHDRIVPPE